MYHLKEQVFENLSKFSYDKMSGSGCRCIHMYFCGHLLQRQSM